MPWDGLRNRIQGYAIAKRYRQRRENVGPRSTFSFHSSIRFAINVSPSPVQRHLRTGCNRIASGPT